MSIAEISKIISDIQELTRMQEELTAEIDALKDRVKAHMSAHDVTAITAGPWRVTYQDISSARIDTAALKRELPDVAEKYTRTSTSKRFTIK